MNIGLIDVDGHNYPNLCLMKLSAWHKSQGDRVEWYRQEAPDYDIVYMSKVFSDVYSPDIETPQNARQVIRGGLDMPSPSTTAKKCIIAKWIQNYRKRSSTYIPITAFIRNTPGMGNRSKSKLLTVS